MMHGHHATAIISSKFLMGQVGPLYSDYHVWVMKIKDAFDPNKISNPLP